LLPFIEKSILTLNKWSSDAISRRVQSVREDCSHYFIASGRKEEEWPGEDPQEGNKEDPYKKRIVSPVIDKAKRADLDLLMGSFNSDGGMAPVGSLLN
jgi:hypothetical protein